MVIGSRFRGSHAPTYRRNRACKLPHLLYAVASRVPVPFYHRTFTAHRSCPFLPGPIPVRPCRPFAACAISASARQHPAARVSLMPFPWNRGGRTDADGRTWLRNAVVVNALPSPTLHCPHPTPSQFCPHLLTMPAHPPSPPPLFGFSHSSPACLGSGSALYVPQPPCSATLCHIPPHATTVPFLRSLPAVVHCPRYLPATHSALPATLPHTTPLPPPSPPFGSNRVPDSA